jgi:MFS family permease
MNGQPDLPSPTPASPSVTGRPIRLPSTFRALRHRNYRLWFIGQLTSLIGTWMQVVAQQVLIYRLTGSAAALGLVSFIGLIPVIPFALWGGSISDRFPRRTILLITQSTMLVQAFIMAYLTWSGKIQVWQVYLLSLLLSIAVAVDLPARQAFTYDMVEAKEDLTNALGLNSAMFNAARTIGPALAGLLIAATGEGTAFFLNGLSFVAVIGCLLLMRNLPRPVASSKPGENMVHHMAEGLRFVVKQPVVLALVSLVGVSAFLSMPYNTLLPIFAAVVLKSSAQPVIGLLCDGTDPILRCQAPEAIPLGMLYALVGIGAVTGALFVASLKDQAPRGKLLTAGNLAFPIFLLFFAISRSFVVSLILMFLIGFSFVWQNALANTLLMLISPDALRGRIMSVYTLTFQSMMRLGGLQAGLMAEWIGAPLALGIGAVGSLLYGLFIALRYPQIRKL